MNLNGSEQTHKTDTCLPSLYSGLFFSVNASLSLYVQMYRVLLDRHEELLVQLDLTARRLPEVQRAIDEFEVQKICYLPLTTFLLKPVQRLLHYQLILDRKFAFVVATFCLRR